MTGHAGEAKLVLAEVDIPNLLIHTNVFVTIRRRLTCGFLYSNKAIRTPVKVACKHVDQGTACNISDD